MLHDLFYLPAADRLPICPPIARRTSLNTLSRPVPSQLRLQSIPILGSSVSLISRTGTRSDIASCTRHMELNCSYIDRRERKGSIVVLSQHEQQRSDISTPDKPCPLHPTSILLQPHLRSIPIFQDYLFPPELPPPALGFLYPSSTGAARCLRGADLSE